MAIELQYFLNKLNSMAKVKKQSAFPLRDNSNILSEARKIIKRMPVVKKPSLNTYILEAIREYNLKHL